MTAIRLDARVRNRGVLIVAQREHGLVYRRGLEHVEGDEQAEIVDRQSRDRPGQVGFELCDDFSWRILAKVGELHEGRDASRELDQLFLDLLSLALLLLLFVRQLFPQLWRQIIPCLLLRVFHRLGLIDDGFED